MSFKSDRRAVSMVGLVAMAIGVLTLIVTFTIIPIVGSQLNASYTLQSDVAATGTLTFSGNVTFGELVNITNGATTYTLEFANGTATKSSYIAMDVSGGNNTSALAPSIFVTAFNGNATVAALATAYNGSGTVTITWDTVGTVGNSVGTTETGAQTAFASTKLTGGVDGSDWNPTHNTNIPTGVSLWESLGSILKVASIILVVAGFLQTLREIRSE